jgi:diaminopimelate decarboxylase
MLTLSPDSPAQRRLPLFPITAAVAHGGSEGVAAHLTIAGCDLRALAAEHGTPLYLYDAATLDAAAAEYRAALQAHYPGPTAITYAGKAWLCTAAAQWANRQRLWLDCTGAGELHIARVAGFPRARILVHGVNKSDADLRAAVEQAAVIVVDNLGELQRLAALLAGQPVQPELWLRVRPGVAVETHSYRQTGQEESKFGLGPAETVEALGFALRAGLKVTGIHFHQGSHFHDVAPVGPGLATVLDLVEELRATHGWTPAVLSPGGGWGVPYHEDDLPHPTIGEYVRFVAGELAAGCAARGLPLPRLQLEPGRSLVARAGVALYRTGAAKRSGGRHWLLLDGGLADNPRPALYGARYTALPVADPQRPATGPSWLGGPFCESGDVLIEGLPLPYLVPGELVAVPVAGAYQLSMGSNYNGARRPAVLWLRDGAAHLIQRRESLDALTARDCPLP